MPDICTVLVLLSFFSNILFSSGQSNQVCTSLGGRFPPFLSDGQPPRKAAKGPRDLAFCRVFRKSTCCDVAQTYPALLSVRRLASAGQATQECLDLWELLECSICDPRVGTQPGPPVICASLCDSVWEACSSAFFSIDAKTQVLSPCGLNDILCGRVREWVSNGTELCHATGFSVQPTGTSFEVVQKQFCYGGKASLDSIADSWKSSRSELTHKATVTGMVQDFQQWATKVSVTERISWAVGGMVLTAGLFFFSKRKGYTYRQKQAAIHRAARKLEAKANQSSRNAMRR